MTLRRSTLGAPNARNRQGERSHAGTDLTMPIRLWRACEGITLMRGRPNTRVTSRQIDHKSANREFMSRSNRPYGFSLAFGKGLVGCVLQVLLGEAPQADETRM